MYTFSFATKEDSTLSLLSTDNEFLKTLGVEFGASNKVNVSGKLDQDALPLDASAYDADDKGNLDLTINGTKISGITKDSTISDILDKINNSKAGVKATYVDTTGQFMLVSNETGSGRKIKLDS